MSCYAVLNPEVIPPLLRVDLHSVELYGEVNVIASCHAVHAALAHHLALLDHVTFVHIDMAEMPQDRLQCVAKIDNNAIAVDAERRGIDNPAVVECLNSYMAGDCDIVAEEALLIDPFPLIDNVLPRVDSLAVY